MLALTQEAATAIRAMLSSAPMSEDAGLRIFTTRRENGGAGLELALAEEPADSDQVVEEAEARVFLEPVAAAALDDKVLDARAEDEGITFLIADQV
jgi:iron-sulfur cluster assembly protein